MSINNDRSQQHSETNWINLLWKLRIKTSFWLDGYSGYLRSMEGRSQVPIAIEPLRSPPMQIPLLPMEQRAQQC